jgi:UDP-N-acetylglucosamine--N-acetylmuramyl-(pentapeptide) pyrophosphoryl-undecaprenol N-acetylglucosamine transferase
MNIEAREIQSATHQAPPKLRISLAASGGGHLHEKFDLRKIWEDFDHYFVTEDTPIANSLAVSEQVHLVPAIAFGHFRAKPLFQVLLASLENIRAAWRIARTARPNVILSTGAGSVFFVVMFAKLSGAKYVHLEPFCRFETPSIFGRLAHRFADAVFIQAEPLAKAWPGAKLFDPFVRLPPSTEEREDMGLVTVGTVLPFDRLVNGVAALRAEDGRPSRMIAQVGLGGTRPNGMEASENIAFEEMTSLLGRAKVVFCHAGNGSLMSALQAGCRIVAMPRRADLGEHWDDHQQEILRAFAARGVVEVAVDVDDLQPALERALAKPAPRARNDHSALIERLRALTREWFGELAPAWTNATR